MDDYKQVLDKANRAFDKHIREEPDRYEEGMRNSYVLSRLENAYERIYMQMNELNKPKKADK